ncbi:MAG: class I SAM-dependent methyltransferase [Acidimicrobiales bacterium]
MGHLPSANLRSAVGHLSDEDWLSLVDESRGANTWEHDFRLPGFPGADVESMTTMPASAAMLREAGRFYGITKQALEQHGDGLNHDTQLLDFGCGWGRITRYFLKDVEVGSIHGVDVVDELVQACRETIAPDQFSAVPSSGPLPFADASFDVVLANSVFSHFDADRHRLWINELGRVAKPGGLLLLTVVDQKALAKWLDRTGDWREWFDGVVGPAWRVRLELASGRFVWRSTSRQGALEGYGLAFVPQRWSTREWRRHDLEIVDIRRDYGQAVYVARKH